MPKITLEKLVDLLGILRMDDNGRVRFIFVEDTDVREEMDDAVRELNCFFTGEE